MGKIQTPEKKSFSQKLKAEKQALLRHHKTRFLISFKRAWKSIFNEHTFAFIINLSFSKLTKLRKSGTNGEFVCLKFFFKSNWDEKPNGRNVFLFYLISTFSIKAAHGSIQNEWMRDNWELRTIKRRNHRKKMKIHEFLRVFCSIVALL